MFACVDCANPHTLRSGDKMKLQELQSVAEVISGYAFKSELIKSGHDRIIRIGDLQNGRVEIDSAITFDSADYGVSEQFRILENDILMALSGATVGKIAVAHNLKERCYLNQRVAIVRAKDKTSQSYLKYVFSGRYLEKLLMSAGGVAQPNLSPKSLEKMEIPLPDLPTQTQIAKILDKSTALIAKRKAQIAELDVLVQSVFLEMFGDPITNPKGWEIGKIKDVILKSQYGTSNKASETEGEYPILRMNNITYQGEMDYSNLKYIDLGEKDKEKHLVHKGELLFNRTNSKELVGKTGLYNLDKPMAFAGYLIKIIPNKEKINSQFLLAYMNSKYIKAILFNMAKNIIGMANINAKEMENISLYIPELNLQTQFAQIVEKIQTQKSQLQQSLAELEIQHQALMQRAFRGKLV